MIRKIYTEEAKKEYVRNYLLSDLSQKDFVEPTFRRRVGRDSV